MSGSELARELEVALNETASRVLNARGAEMGCPALVWFLPGVGRVWQAEGLRGLSDVDPRGNAVENARRWAEAFGLSRDSAAVPGTVGYVGRIDGVAVDVWVVVDDDVFNRGVILGGAANV